MADAKLPKAVCAVVGEVLLGSHQTLNALFQSAGAPGEPPELAHHSKWKEWLYRAGQDPDVDGLKVLGSVLEEFMDLPPRYETEEHETWERDRQRVIDVLGQYGLRYYQGGRVLPNGEVVQPNSMSMAHTHSNVSSSNLKPASVGELLEVLVKGLPRAMHPLTYRRKGAQPLRFESEYDLQDLLHSLLRPWVADIRPEEYTPSYAGSSTRMDFLLPRYSTVIELKHIRDQNHGKKVGDELILDVAHYQRHQACRNLWCVVYDPGHLIPNPNGLAEDLEGERSSPDGEVHVKAVVVAPGM